MKISEIVQKLIDFWGKEYQIPIVKFWSDSINEAIIFHIGYLEYNQTIKSSERIEAFFKENGLTDYKILVSGESENPVKFNPYLRTVEFEFMCKVDD